MQIIRCAEKSTFNQLEETTKRICSRHILVFGEDLQLRLSELIIGVVCVGGLGSLLIEQLMRLFPRKLIFIDKDYVDITNLNRLISATLIDVKLKTKKNDLATHYILNFNPKQKLKAIFGDFLEKNNQEIFKQCDFVFGASDSNAVRLALNRLCLANAIPYFDCGSGAEVNKIGLKEAGGQIIKILPDSSFCLHCANLFDVKSAMNDFLPFEERKRQEQQGYILGANIPAPQVYSLNMMVASWAIWFFKRYVAGEELDFDVFSIDAKNNKTIPWKVVKKQSNDCLTCGPNGIVFKGDDADLLCCTEEDEVDEGANCAIKFVSCGASTNESKKLPEFPIPPYPELIMGKDESTPFAFGLWVR
ncbi:ThiF family adenylyltransferase [Candidatus Microgenomates bacterium]|nr:ThiF family adenylyltransferase [Candidatus Microgenomates bacterium]